jgi:hypothetical protein
MPVTWSGGCRGISGSELRALVETALGRRHLTCHLSVLESAPKGRQLVAQGASPGERANQNAKAYPGLAPWATNCRPFGAIRAAASGRLAAFWNDSPCPPPLLARTGRSGFPGRLQFAFERRPTAPAATANESSSAVRGSRRAQPLTPADERDWSGSTDCRWIWSPSTYIRGLAMPATFSMASSFALISSSMSSLGTRLANT